MHVIAFLFFVTVFALAIGSLAVMLVGNADHILSALAGHGVDSQRGVTFVSFGDINLSPSPANDAISLPLAA